jgi:hypothetical protein
MRKLIVSTFMTLDGVMQAPGAPEEDRDGGFEHGGWAFGYWDEVVDETMHASMTRPFDLLLGRRTYEIFAAHWPHSEEPAAAPLNDATKYVASTTLTVGRVAELAAPARPVGRRRQRRQGAGRSRHPGPGQRRPHPVAARRQADRRVQRLDVPAHPRHGEAALRARAPAGGLEVIDSKVSPSGVIMTRYRTGAEMKGGSFVQAELDRRAAQEG